MIGGHHGARRQARTTGRWRRQGRRLGGCGGAGGRRGIGGRLVRAEHHVPEDPGQKQGSAEQGKPPRRTRLICRKVVGGGLVVVVVVTRIVVRVVVVLAVPAHVALMSCFLRRSKGTPRRARFEFGAGRPNRYCGSPV